MSEIEIKSELEDENNQESIPSNEIILIQKNKWEQTKFLISKKICI